MRTLQEALEIGESIDTEFKSWIKASSMKERISLAVDEFAGRAAGCHYGFCYLLRSAWIYDRPTIVWDFH